MAHGDERECGIHFSGCFTHGSVMGGHAFRYGRLPVFGIVALTADAHIPVPEIGHGADKGRRSAVSVLKRDHFLLHTFGHAADDAHADPFQHIGRGVEPGGRIMVAARDDGLPAAGGAKAGQEGIVKSGRVVGRHDLVKNIARHKQGVDVFAGDEIREPAEERFVFLVSRGVVEGCAEVPVGSMQELHNDSGEKGGPVLGRRRGPETDVGRQAPRSEKQPPGKDAGGKRVCAGRGTHFSAALSE